MKVICPRQNCVWGQGWVVHPYQMPVHVSSAAAWRNKAKERQEAKMKRRQMKPVKSKVGKIALLFVLVYILFGVPAFAMNIVTPHIIILEPYAYEITLVLVGAGCIVGFSATLLPIIGALIRELRKL